MSDHPSPYVPSKSSFTRFLNRTMPAVGVPIEQLKPDPAYVQLILGAAYDIRICQKIFDGWAAQLDKLDTKKFEERERTLWHHLIILREEAGWCSESWLKRLKYRQDTTRLANDINKASRELSQHVRTHPRELEVVRICSGEDGGAKEELSIFALGSFVSPFLRSVAPGLSLITPAASTLWKAAAAFCERASGKESESIESVLLFLKDTVPKEAHTAQKSLARFDEARLVMGLEARMKTGRRVALRGPNPALTAVAQEWRKIAKQYQLMLSDKEDPDN
ncbi:hypothetical protein H4582DRAFT_2098968 [Lactarius indigo]|nr:hypothetical protein H4582DRAFT_2098968 [Lactarius indigo]